MYNRGIVRLHMPPKVVIGVTGEKGGGKSTAAKFIKDLVAPLYTIEVISTGSILMEDLSLWGVSLTRENLMKRANQIVQIYGKDTLALAAARRIIFSSADIAIYDAVRWDADLGVLLQMPNSRLLYITADFETRWDRARRRAEKGEGQITKEQFLSWESEPTERDISRLGKLANWRYISQGTLDDFRENMKAFLESHVLPNLPKKQS